jgi:NADH dehydrogenase
VKYENILVVGGSGFVGRHLVAALAGRGARVCVPTRRRERAKHLILLPTVEVVEADVNDANALARLAAGRDAVINLAGILHGPGFKAAHVELAQSVVNACRRGGARRLLHMSAIGADPAGPSEYLRSKGMGEEAVLAADDLEVTVFRPSIVFGPEDRFLNLFSRLSRFFPVLGVASPEARFQPVYVGDVVKAMLAALDDPQAAGKTFNLCGPRVYTLRELMQFVCAVTGRRRLVFGLPDGLGYLQAWMMEWLPVKLMTRDNLRSMRVPSVCGDPFPYGIRPQAMEALAPSWLAPSGPRERYPQLRWRARR